MRLLAEAGWEICSNISNGNLSQAFLAFALPFLVHFIATCAHPSPPSSLGSGPNRAFENRWKAGAARAVQKKIHGT